MTAKTTEQLLQDLISLQKSNARNSASTTSTADTGAFGQAMGMATKAFNPLTAMVGKAKEGFEFLQDAVKPSLDTFRTLSKTGASFSNDIVGMTVASKNMRLELDEFADIMKNNAANFTGLGGSVTRGAEQFAKLSKGLMESPFIDTLRQAGYNNKELNDVLALQVGFMRTSMADGKERDQEAIDSAQKLATEMDLMAKLTGKSREEQMENMKKAQADMQVEAKMRLIGIKEGPDAEAKARKLYAEQYNEAQLRGQGQVFKETFALGQVVSKEAATQVALSGKEGIETQRAARATQKGEEDEARAASKAARVEAIKNGQDVARLNLALTGDMTTAGKAVTDSMTANRGLNDSIVALRKENDAQVASGKARKMTDEELDTEAKKRAAAAAQGTDAEGKKVSGATDAMINLGSRAKDVTAALTDSLLTPLNKQIGPGLSIFTDTYLRGTVQATGKSVSQTVRDTATRGREEAIQDENQGTGPLTGKKRKIGDIGGRQPDAYLGESALKNVAYGTQQLTGAAATGIEETNKLGNAPKKRQTGSIGETGQLIENFGLGTPVILHGREAVMTEPQIMNMAKGFQIDGMKNQAQNYEKSIGMNIDKMKKDIISFSTSSKSSSSTASTSTNTDTNKVKSGMSSTAGVNEIDRKSLKFDQFGMPISQDIKYKTNQITDDVKKKEEEKKAISAAPAPATAPAAPAEKKSDAPKPAATTSKESSLSDVVASLNQLNSKVSQLIDVQKDVGQRQIKAVKANSKDVYNQ
jgi:hypothetical protein